NFLNAFIYLPFGVVLHPCALLLVWLAVVASGEIGIVSRLGSSRGASSASSALPGFGSLAGSVGRSSGKQC
ncbi:hypothetical protein QBC32DRAFT_344879, partial [Pseudoneurospora amorphoporcata]